MTQIKNQLVKFLLFSLVLVLVQVTVSVKEAQAATVTAASCNQADVQSAVNSAQNNDTVIIPAGNCTWSRTYPTFYVEWSNKNIHIKGSGMDVTKINCEPCFRYISSAASSIYSKWRISDMTLNGTIGGHGNGIITIIDDNAASVPNVGWRIDHIKFDYPTGNGGGDGIMVEGPTYGVIDHNIWNWAGGLSVMCLSIHSHEYPSDINDPAGNFMMSQPLDMGTANSLFIEDNTFNILGGAWNVYDTASGGCRSTFRYNTVTSAHYMSHWTRGREVGGLVHEIYNNKFEGTSNFNFVAIRLDSGTGAIFNNQLTGYPGAEILVTERRGFLDEDHSDMGDCDGTRAWDGNAGDPAAPGWPCLGQIGRSPGKSMAQVMAGDKQASAPLYIWNNGSDLGCRTGGSCANDSAIFVYDGTTQAKAYVKPTAHPNGEVDYVIGSTPKPGYSAYTYPHPLVSGAAAPSPPPTPGPTPTPAPVPAPSPVPSPVPTPAPTPTLQPAPAPSPTPSSSGSLPLDGTLIKDSGSPTIYIVEFGKKRPFASWEAFAGLGFLGKPLVTMSTSAISTGAGIFTKDTRHTRGVLVLLNGTVWFLGADIKYGFPSAEVFHSWGRQFSEVVPGNRFDAAMPDGEVVRMRQ
jgi:hypothetical protein